MGTRRKHFYFKISKIISKLTGFKGKIIFDQFSRWNIEKNLNLKRIKKIGWYPKIKLKDGLKEVINSRLY